MYWVYIIESRNNKKRYIGYTKSLKGRLKQHQKGKVFSTKFMRPFNLIYVEGCLNKEDAIRREKYLKTTGSRRFLAKRLRKYYESQRKNF
jgi:putative endonuclease